jgi:hypothetical protein
VNNYFGEPWESGICDGGTRQATPVGKECFFCEEAIVEGDRGVFIVANPCMAESMAEDHIVWLFTQHPYDPNRGYVSIGMNAAHRECQFREVMGGIGHHEDHVRWCLTEHDTDGGRTRHQSSIEVWERLTREGVL